MSDQHKLHFFASSAGNPRDLFDDTAIALLSYISTDYIRDDTPSFFEYQTFS